jgi:hypothetical protein
MCEALSSNPSAEKTLIWNFKRPRVAKVILSKKNGAESILTSLTSKYTTNL